MKLTFKNIGHAIATGAKHFVQGLDEIVKGAAKVEVVAPEVDLLVGALAGPQAARISDLAFHALGDVAASLEKVSTDVKADQTTMGLNVTMDVQTVADIKAVAQLIKGLIQAKGGTLPAA